MVSITHDSVVIDQPIQEMNWSGASPSSAFNVDFQATATSLTFDSVSVGGSTAILGNSTFLESWSTITEIPPKQETNEF